MVSSILPRYLINLVRWENNSHNVQIGLTGSEKSLIESEQMRAEPTMYTFSLEKYHFLLNTLLAIVVLIP